MKKTITLLLSIAVMIGCMAMPVAAGNNTLDIFYTNMTTQYQGATLCDQGSAYVGVRVMAAAYIALVDANGTARGKNIQVYTCNGYGHITHKTGWVDHAYNNKSVDCHQHYY